MGIHLASVTTLIISKDIISTAQQNQFIISHPHKLDLISPLHATKANQSLNSWTARERGRERGRERRREGEGGR